ncbi:MAG: hydantoinase B/oxoprolinase family protein [Planctomycetaceae bacterium]
MGGIEFWIDVGGTFTDCLARAPDGSLRTLKVLSSGTTKGRIDAVENGAVVDPLRIGDAPGFWSGYEFRLVAADGAVIERYQVTESDTQSGRLILDRSLTGLSVGARYELASGEEAPIVAIRTALGLRLTDPIPPVTVKLGTTRGTNALLTRTGARTVLVTNRGFADVLTIGNQDRPRLFDLAVRRPTPLFEKAVEIAGRLDAAGREIEPIDIKEVRNILECLKSDGFEAVAICLMNAYADPSHEAKIAAIARAIGFDDVSASSEVAPRIKFIPRGDTTVVDAYLNPVLRGYVDRLRASLVGSPSGAPTVLKVMSSAGGLLAADRFTGKDSILSGPAGGVVGFSRVAERAGFPRAIGFDMGGTSTDVSRFDGTHDIEFEGTKAGVRLATPMLAIETVAAGGGSICRFDGVKLAVGPQSAGADPGPACYGRGGPLTVTDVNLFLGRILADRFPFPLDRKSVERRLAVLCDEVAASPLGRRYTPLELARGFRTIAIEAMARAIRTVSIARGYDPADYTLVTFGGAGGQHACELADVLGITTVLAHPHAGVLSAYGIGVADIRRFGERPILKVVTSELVRELETAFDELAKQATADVLAEGIARDRLEMPRRLLDLRYVGTETSITVTWAGTATATLDAFADLHRRQYGYVRDGRQVECTAVRIEVVGRIPNAPDPERPVVPRSPEQTEFTNAEFAGIEQSVPVFDRTALRPGDRLTGPAIVFEPTSTFVLDSGWKAEVTGRGDLVASVVTNSKPTAGLRLGDEGADPVQLELFNNLFASIAEQMGEVLRRTSVSTNVKERLDYSCAIFDAGGNLVVNAPHIPVHLGAMGETVKAVLADNPSLAPGDVVVTNDPYRGGSHLPDVTVVTPMHDAQSGRLLFLTASRAHHAEIGGIVPGSMPPFSKSLADEGILIRNFKLVDHGESHEEQLKELLSSGPHPSRNVADNLADIAAQVAANRRGTVLLGDLVERFTLSVVVAYMGHIRAAAGEKVRLALQSRPDGMLRFVDHLDEGSPIAVAITLRGGEAVVDFTGTGPVLGSNLNANRAIVTAAVLYVFRCLIAEDIPLNGGVLDPVTVILPECLLNPPPHEDPAQCAAIVGGNVETSQRVVDVLLGAFGVAAASQGTMNNLTFGNSRFGYYETICGGTGATPDADGCSGIHSHMTNTRLTDAEVLERRYPVRVKSFRFRIGSGGEGLRHGGDGIIRELVFCEPLSVAMLSERRGPNPPFGLAGGCPGALGRNRLHRKDGAEVELAGKFRIEVDAGDRLIIETPGGGGFGASP